MNFDFSEEQLLLRKTVRQFVDHEIIPHMAKWELDGAFDPAIWKRLADLGLMGVCIPEKYGGSGMDYNSLAIVCEELERGDTAFRTAVSVHTGLNSMTLMQWATEEQKIKYLLPQANGEKIGAFGLTEPGAGSDVASMSTVAVLDGDDYILNGQKTWISLCDVADHFIVFAYTDKSKSIMVLVRLSWSVHWTDFHLKRLKVNMALSQEIQESYFLIICGCQKKIFLGKREKDLRLPCQP